MIRKSSFSQPLIPDSGLDRIDKERLAEFLGLHLREEADFKDYACAHFKGKAYDDIDFEKHSVSEIRGKLRVDPTKEDYKEPYSNYLVKISDDDTSNNDKLTFEVVPKPAPASPPDSFFPFYLFVCIMEFYKGTAAGDLIDGDLEFSWGKRIRVLTGKEVLTVLFRFKYKVDGTLHFYDYSSEFPDYYPQNLIYLKRRLMNA